MRACMHTYMHEHARLQDITRYSASHAYAAMAVTSAIKGFLQRERLLEQLEAEGVTSLEADDILQQQQQQQLQQQAAQEQQVAQQRGLQRFLTHMAPSRVPVPPADASPLASPARMGMGGWAGLITSPRRRGGGHRGSNAGGGGDVGGGGMPPLNHVDLSKPLTPRLTPGSPRLLARRPDGVLSPRVQGGTAGEAQGMVSPRADHLQHPQQLQQPRASPGRRLPAAAAAAPGGVPASQAVLMSGTTPRRRREGGAGGGSRLRPTTTALQGFLQPVIAERC